MKVIQVATYLRSTSGSGFERALQRGKHATDLQQYAPGAKVSDPKETEINGHKAIQWEVHWIGPENNFRWGGVITCFATHRYFAEVRKALCTRIKIQRVCIRVARLCSHNSRSARPTRRTYGSFHKARAALRSMFKSLPDSSDLTPPNHTAEPPNTPSTAKYAREPHPENLMDTGKTHPPLHPPV